MRKTVFLLYVILASCVVDQADLSRYTGSEVDNIEEARNVEVVYTDSSYLIFKLQAPLSKRIYSKYSVIEEFPEGIEVTFYDKSGTPRSWLSAQTAVRDQANRKITVRENVVLRNDQGEQLTGPELIWDEKKKEIYTDRFVKITRADGTIVYSHGFRSNEGFTRYELNAVSGDMYFREENPTPDPIP